MMGTGSLKMRTFTLFIIFSLPAPSLAGDEYATLPEKNQHCYLCSLLDRPQIFLSDNLLKFSEGIDLFFSKSRSYDKLNKSFASLDYYIVNTPSAHPKHYLDTRVYIILPGTQEHLAFMLQTETDSELDSDNPDIVPSSPDENTEALALRSDISSGKQWRIFMDVGAEYQNGVDPFIRVTYNHNYKFDRWSINWREAMFRFANNGNGITSALRTDRIISERNLLRISNRLIDYIDLGYSDSEHSISLANKLNDYSALIYTVGTYSNHQPTDNTDYLQLRYKRLIHKTWLYYEIIPEVLFSDSNNKIGSGRLTIKLQYLIGNY